MARYVTRRVLSGLLILFALTLVTFVVFRAIPVNPACIILPCGSGHVTEAQIKAADHKLGVDRPVIIQYARFVWSVLRHGQFGASWHGFSIDSSLRAALPVTGSILLGGVLILLLVALPLGILSAFKAQTAIDRAVLFFSIIGVALHPFVLGTGLRFAFAKYLHVLPLGGYCPATAHRPINGGFWVPPNNNFTAPRPTCGGPVDWADHLVLPWITFAAFFLPLYVRLIRARVLETLHLPHVSTARAKGASEQRILRSHVLRLALLPLGTMVAMDIGGALMATIYIEFVYRISGIGSLALNQLSGEQLYDLPMIAAIFFVIATAIVAFNLIADLGTAFLDPRTRSPATQN